MIVHRPATDRYRILEIAILPFEIVLGERVVADTPRRTALAWHHSQPIHAPIGAARQVARIFDVIPHAEDDREQLEPDPFVVADRVELAAPFDPPIAVFPRTNRTKPKLFLGNLTRPLG